MTVKIILAALETALLALFVISYPVFNLGNLTGILVSCALLFITLRFDVFSGAVKGLQKHIGGKLLICACCLMIVAAVGFAVFCSVRMTGAMSITPENPSAVVVLGCQVKGERPSRMLKYRLDAALVYLNENPGVPVVVSGGKGPDEAISEALCMKNYLVENGIPESRIIMEDKSTSTDENLEFSFAILDSMGLGRDIVLVTDGYHQYRAQLIAKRHGAGRVFSVSASTEFRFIPTYWVREWFGIAQQMFLK